MVIYIYIYTYPGYSGSDLQALCEEAAMMPIRELGPQNILTISASQVKINLPIKLSFSF